MHQPGHASASTKTLDGLTRVRPVPDAEQRRGSGQLVRHQYLDDLAVRQVRPRIRWPQPVDDPRDVQPTQKLGSDRQSAQALGHHGLNHDLHTTPSARTTLRAVYETVLKPSGWLRRLRVGQGRQSSTWYLGDGSQPQSPCSRSPDSGRRQPGRPTATSGLPALRSGQAILRPPGDLADRAQPARELDRRSDRTGRWSVAPTALDPLPPRTPQPTRTGPGG